MNSGTPRHRSILEYFDVRAHLKSAPKVVQALAGLLSFLLVACGGSSHPSGTDDAVIATVSPLQSVRAYLGRTSLVTVSFTTTGGGTATQLASTSSLTQLPAGWTSGVQMFSCASVVAAGCVLRLSFTPVATGSGQLNLSFRYLSRDGASQTLDVAIPYSASQPQLQLLAGWVGGAGNLDGVGSAARFARPRSVAIDHTGSIYVSDAANFKVRKIAPGGSVTTLAGSGASSLIDGLGPDAAFAAPGSLAVDPGGNVFISDSGSVRMVSTAGVVSTVVAGPWAPGPPGTPQNLPGPVHGVAADTIGNVYVSTNSVDASTQRTIARISSAGAVQIVAGAGGEFKGELGELTTDTAGNLYVVEAAAGVRSVTPQGVVATAAPYNPSFPADDGGVAVDLAGSILTSSGNAIYRYFGGTFGKVAGTDVAGSVGAWSDGGPSSTAPYSEGGGAYFDAPHGLAFDVQGNLIVADSANSVIRNVSTARVVTTVAGAGVVRGTAEGVGTAARFDIALGADYLAHWTCQVICDGFSGAAGGLAADAFGNIYVADTGYGLIRMVASDGTVTTVHYVVDTSGADCCVNYGPVCCALEGGVAIDSAGLIYITVALGDVQELTRPTAIAKIKPDGSASLVKDSSGKAVLGFVGSDLAVAHDGTIYIPIGTGVLRITPAGTATVWVGGTAGARDGTGSEAQFNGASGIAIAPSGDIYVSDTGSHTIRRITSAGVVTTVAGAAGASGATDGPGAAARFSSPGALAFDASGILYIADTGNYTIRRLFPDHSVDTLLGTAGLVGTRLGMLPGSLDYPQGIAIRSDGQLEIAVDAAVLVTQDL
jgi:sugar lactone lactonase YvrE